MQQLLRVDVSGHGTSRDRRVDPLNAIVEVYKVDQRGAILFIKLFFFVKLRLYFCGLHCFDESKYVIIIIIIIGLK